MNTADISKILWTIDPMRIAYIAEDEYDIEAKSILERLVTETDVRMVVAEVFDSSFSENCIDADQVEQIANAISEMKK
jgi:hypothetical protein